MKQNLPRNFKIGLLGAVVSLMAVLFVVSQINLAQFSEALAAAQYIYVLPCILFLLIGLAARAYRWRVLLNDQLLLARAFSIMNVAYLVNGVLPLRIGEIARIFLASRSAKAMPVMQVASTIVVERLLDLLAVTLMTALAFAFGPVPDELRRGGIFFGVVSLLGFITLILLARYREGLLTRVNTFLDRRGTFKRFQLRDWLVSFLEGLLPLTRNRSLLAALGWTGIAWALSVLAGYVLMLAFYPEGSLAATLLYIAAAAFAIALPAVPGNIGTYEASILLALGAVGYEQSGTALAFAVMVHAVNVFVHVSTGVIGFIQEGISLEQLSQGVRQVQQNTNVG